MGAFKGAALPWLILCSIIAPAASEDSTYKYFFGDGPPDLTRITWAHAVNSKAELVKRLAGNCDHSIFNCDGTMMLESDVSLGMVHGNPEKVPVMAHPPATTSDLSFKEYIELVTAAIQSGAKKGVKVDFKDINVVEQCLKLIVQLVKDKFDFPLWFNADILQGPCAGIPVDRNAFLNLTQVYYKKALLSLGWTTFYNYIIRPTYEKTHVNEMINFVQQHPLLVPSTFPVRAGMAAESRDEIYRLVTSIPYCTITLWSSEGDHVNMKNLCTLIKLVGFDKTYADLPFSIHECRKVVF